MPMPHTQAALPNDEEIEEKDDVLSLDELMEKEEEEDEELMRDDGGEDEK